MKIITRKLAIVSKYYLIPIKIIRAGGGNARLIGGVVRDALLGIQSVDIDMVTDLLPYEVMSLFNSRQIKVIPTGIKFGTVTVIINNEKFEITTLRRDLLCDGRHALVEYTKDFKEDALRRDFTINALSYCPIENKIYDYFNGIVDLLNKQVVFIGNSEDRIKEDYLRILRFFRFSSRFAKDIDRHGLAACVKMKQGLKFLSLERIKSEFDLLLPLNNAEYYLNLIFVNKLLDNIFPVTKFDPSTFLYAKKFAHGIRQKINLSTFYALFFAYVSDISLYKLISLKFSRKEANFIVEVRKIRLSDSSDIVFDLTIMWLENKECSQYFIYAAAVSNFYYGIKKLFYKLSQKKILKVPVNGQDLMNLGYKGSQIKDNLNLLKSQWIKRNFVQTKEELILLLKKHEK